MFNRKKIKALEDEIWEATMKSMRYKQYAETQDITIKELKAEVEEWKLKYLNMVEKNIKLAEMRMRINDR